MTESMTAVRPTPEQVMKAFLTPRPTQGAAPDFPPGAVHLFVDTPSGRIALRRANSGTPGAVRRPVLLLHGWEGQPTDFAAFVPPLLAAGFDVLPMDLPAHGDSAGSQTNIPHAARALRSVGEVMGPFHAVIAHSIGSAVAAEALHGGLAAERVVLISAPAHYAVYAAQTGRMAGLDEAGVEQLLQALREPLGMDIHEVSLPRRAPTMQHPALFIHSADDRVVPVADSETTAAAWPGARHRRLDGLGHRRILQDAGVVAEALQFISST